STTRASPLTCTRNSLRSPSSLRPGSGNGTRYSVTETVAPGVAQDLGVRELAAATLQRATDHLLGLQNPAGWWQGELETNVTMDAEDLLLRHFLGILTPEVAREAAI